MKQTSRRKSDFKKKKVVLLCIASLFEFCSTAGCTGFIDVFSWNLSLIGRTFESKHKVRRSALEIRFADLKAT